jgi:hypothetical protein
LFKCSIFGGSVQVEVGIEVMVEHHDFDPGKALANGLAEFLGVEVGEAAVEKEYLPGSALQPDESLGTAHSLLAAANRRT